MYDPIEYIKVPRFMLDILGTIDYYETDNEPLAWAAFHGCQFECELRDHNRVIAEKEFIDCPETDSSIALVESNYTGEEYAELEEVES